MSRSPPKTQIVFDSKSFAPGGRLKGHVLVTVRKPVKMVRVGATAYCREVVKAMDLVGGPTGGVYIPVIAKSKAFEVNADFWQVDSRGARAPVEARTLAAGKHWFAFEATLPNGIAPTFARSRPGLKIEVRYFVKIRVWLRRRLDWRATSEFRVSVPPGAAFGEPLTFGSRRGHRRRALDVALNSPGAVRGLRLSGLASISGGRPKKVRGLNVRLVERVEGKGTALTHGFRRRVLAQQRVMPSASSGGEIPFSVLVPRNAFPTYHGDLVSVSHELLVEADLAMVRNPKASSKIRMR